MLIDWFTVIAQIINFLILVYLLKRFLYGPILEAMTARETRIARELELAEQKRKKAQLEIQTYREKNQEFDEQRDQMLHQAKAEAETWRHQLFEKARAEVDEAQARWRRAVQQEKEAFLQALRRRAGHQTYVIARQALADLADAELEQRVVDVFVQRLETLAEESRKAISVSLREAEEGVVVYSAFDLPEETRQRLAAVVNGLRHTDGSAHPASNGHAIRFVKSTDLVVGIELRVNGHKISWNLTNYLEELEAELLEVLEARAEARHD